MKLMPSLAGLGVLLMAFAPGSIGGEPPALADSWAPAEEGGDEVLQHVGPYGLCGTENIYPVAVFYGQYVDPVGNHYHLWRPPAGPPFAELCLRGSELTWKGR